MENVEKWILCFASYDQSKLYIFQEFWFAVAENDLDFDVSHAHHCALPDTVLRLFDKIYVTHVLKYNLEIQRRQIFVSCHITMLSWTRFSQLPTSFLLVQLELKHWLRNCMLPRKCYCANDDTITCMFAYTALRIAWEKEKAFSVLLWEDANVRS